MTEAHLAGLASGFTEAVPILIEHAASPLEIGFLCSVEQEGSELFGSLSLTPEANALVERSGSKSLSLGLSADLSRIREVSLVRNPRIAGAQMFGGDVRFDGALMSDLGFASEWKRLREAQVGQEVSEMVRQGRLCPAQVPFAQAMLMSDEAVEFDGASTPMRQIALSFLSCQPKSVLFAELAPAPFADHSRHLMLPEEAEFYRKHFPDVSLDEIAKTRK